MNRLVEFVNWKYCIVFLWYIECVFVGVLMKYCIVMFSVCVIWISDVIDGVVCLCFI